MAYFQVLMIHWHTGMLWKLAHSWGTRMLRASTKSSTVRCFAHSRWNTDSRVKAQELLEFRHLNHGFIGGNDRVHEATSISAGS